MRDPWTKAAGAACLLLAFTLISSASAFPPDEGNDAGYRWRNVEIVGGGYVPGIVFNQSEPGLVYARTDIGGAYRWEPRSNHWVPLLDWVGANEWGLTGVDSLATDPVDPDRLYVLAGTYTNSWDPNNGAILRSADRGRSWERTPLPFKSGGNMPGRNLGERLVIDPNDHRILFLGTRSGNGLWMSTDYAQTWSRVTSFPAVGSYAPDPSDPSGYSSDPIGVIWITFDQRTGRPGHATQTIYVGVADLGTSIYRSRDGGESWEALPGQPTSPAFMPHHSRLASNGVLYITYNNNAGPYDGTLGDVWKYDTATEVWTKISPDPTSSTNSYFGYGGLSVQDLISPPQGAHLLSALADIGGFRHDDLQTVPNEMYDNPVMSTTTSLDFAGLAPQRIVRVGSGSGNIGFSLDGGTTWTPGTAAGSGGVVALSADGMSAVWSPSGAAVSYSLDNGQTWLASSGVPAGAYVGSDRATASQFYAYSGGVFYVSTDRGVTFTPTGAAGLPSSNVKFKAVAGRAGEIWVAAGTAGLWRSRDAGQTFAKLANVQAADTIGFGMPRRSEGYSALYTSAQIAGVRGIFRSDDVGQHWIRINDDQHQYAVTSAAITGDPRVYGRVYVSTNGRGVIYGEPADARGR